jgi:hypothetical protein
MVAGEGIACTSGAGGRLQGVPWAMHRYRLTCSASDTSRSLIAGFQVREEQDEDEEDEEEGDGKEREDDNGDGYSE